MEHIIGNCVKKLNKKSGICIDDLSIDLNKLIHRLDKDTSGTLLYSNCEECINFAKENIKERKTIKLYVALVYGDIKQCIISNYLGRKNKSNKFSCKYRKDKTHKKLATSYIFPIKIYNIENIIITKIIVQIITGRTHQIRVQLAHLNRSVIGDNIYGPEIQEYNILSNYFKRLMLHSLVYGIKIDDKKYKLFSSILDEKFYNLDMNKII